MLNYVSSLEVIKKSNSYNTFYLLFQYTTNLTIEEHGVSYNQTMTLSILTGDVLMHVPEHERDSITFHEVDRIENEEMVRKESEC